MSHFILPGSERQMLAGARVVRAAHPDEWIEVTLRLAPRQELPDVAALGAVPPAKRQYLSRADFERQYGAFPDHIAKVEAFAAANGLRVVRKHVGGRSIVLAGTVADMSKAFQVKLMRYRAASGETYRGRIGPVFLPQELEGCVTGVFGLDNRRAAKSRARIHPLPVGTSHASTNRPWFLPQELATHYGFPPGNGAGQCIGILEFGGGFDDSDLDTYFRTINVARPHVLAVGVGSSQNDPGPDPGSDGEVMLDIEVAGAVCPAATLAVYFSEFTEKGWIDALTTAVHDDSNRPSVISVSWGFAEGFMIWTNAAIDHVNQLLQEAALLGVTVCFASGDDGSSDDQEDGHAHVDFPSSSPFVLAVGGTNLKVDGTNLTETVWNGGPRATADGAGGGGVSDVLALPSWQNGIAPPVPPSVNPTHFAGRGVPDVAAVADPQTGYFVRSAGKNGVAGGTSAAAPLWAALIARINQGLPKPAGYFNPLLYQKIGPSGACRDVTVGNNDTEGLVGGYSAGPGWDACTGWGTPNGDALAKALAAS